MTWIVLCWAVSPTDGWRCTRPLGHTGPHIAGRGRYTVGDPIRAQWPQTAEHVPVPEPVKEIP